MCIRDRYYGFCALSAVALTLQVSVRPIRNDADETILCLVIFSDVTEQQPAVADSNATSFVDSTSQAPNVNGTYRVYITII